MADKLGVYNEALQTHLDATPLTSLTDARAERRALDRVWAATMKWMIEAGLWNFASRAQQWNSSADVESQFSYQHAFEKPTDYVRLVAISDNEWFRPTLADFSEEGGFFFADVDPLWVKFVSSDAQWGADLGKWPGSFTSAFAAELAYRGRGGVKIMSADAVAELKKEKKKLLLNAQAKDAVNQPMAQLPLGRLVQSRAGSMGQTNRQRRTPYA